VVNIEQPTTGQICYLHGGSSASGSVYPKRKSTLRLQQRSSGMKKPPGIETANQVVRSVSPNDEDCVSLERILKSGWTVTARATPASALSLLREVPIPILICDCDPTPGTWHEMSDHISILPDPPLLILTSRLADERLWAEGLNLGAWDVLAKPFQTEEAIRIVDSAWLHWQDRHGVCSRPTPQRKAATRTEMITTGT
jgi:DNA-binding NtrC family response regulator